jgi:hypothetical protein
VFGAIADLFTTDDIGGWDELNETVFGPDGAHQRLGRSRDDVAHRR